MDESTTELNVVASGKEKTETIAKFDATKFIESLKGQLSPSQLEAARSYDQLPLEEVGWKQLTGTEKPSDLMRQQAQSVMERLGLSSYAVGEVGKMVIAQDVFRGTPREIQPQPTVVSQPVNIAARTLK